MAKRVRVPVSNRDATWLGMDESTNPMVINCLMLLDRRIDYDRLLATLSKRMIARYSRFSQRVVEGTTTIGRMQWESDPHFDIRSHVHHLALPEPGDEAELQRLISMLMSEPLDRTRPLWRIYLVDNLGDGCAVYGRLHHAIGDGIALMRVVLSLTDPAPGTPHVGVAESAKPKTRAGLPGLARSPLRMAGWATGTLMNAARKINTDPIAAQESAREAVDTLKASGLVAAAATANLAKLVLMTKDRDTLFRGELTPIKNVAWSQPIPLQRVKEISRATDTTVNDVLVAAVSGGLRRYMVAADGKSPAGDMRATVPVNLRPPELPLTLGNKFSIVFLTLPISLPEPEDRLRAVKLRMDALKRSPEPQLVYEILSLLGMLPGPVSRPASAWFASKATCILTNVPGPQEPVYFVGGRVERMMFWVPQSRGVGMGISILSYAGHVTIGVMADEALVKDPAQVIAQIEADFAALEQLAFNAPQQLLPQPATVDAARAG